MTAAILGLAVAVGSFCGFLVVLSWLPPRQPDDREFRAYAWLGLAISLATFLGASYARNLP